MNPHYPYSFHNFIKLDMIAQNYLMIFEDFIPSTQNSPFPSKSSSKKKAYHVLTHILHSMAYSPLCVVKNIPHWIIFDHNLLPSNPCCLQTSYEKPDGHFRPILNPGNLTDFPLITDPRKSPNFTVNDVCYIFLSLHVYKFVQQ